MANVKNIKLVATISDSPGFIEFPYGYQIGSVSGGR